MVQLHRANPKPIAQRGFIGGLNSITEVKALPAGPQDPPLQPQAQVQKIPQKTAVAAVLRIAALLAPALPKVLELLNRPVDRRIGLVLTVRHGYLSLRVSFIHITVSAASLR